MYPSCPPREGYNKQQSTHFACARRIVSSLDSMWNLAWIAPASFGRSLCQGFSEGPCRPEGGGVNHEEFVRARERLCVDAGYDFTVENLEHCSDMAKREEIVCARVAPDVSKLRPFSVGRIATEAIILLTQFDRGEEWRTADACQISGHEAPILKHCGEPPQVRGGSPKSFTRRGRLWKQNS